MRRQGFVDGIACAAAFFHRGLCPLCGGNFLRFALKIPCFPPQGKVGRCLSACRRGTGFPLSFNRAFVLSKILSCVQNRSEPTSHTQNPATVCRGGIFSQRSVSRCLSSRRWVDGIPSANRGGSLFSRGGGTEVVLPVPGREPRGIDGEEGGC